MKILKTLIRPLTPDQLEELTGAEIVDLKAIEPELAQFLANCPDNHNLLERNAWRLIDTICDNRFDAALLPCGSPKFAWILSQLWREKGVTAEPWFAHSTRESVEKEVEKLVPIEGTDQFRKVVEKTALIRHVRFF